MLLNVVDTMWEYIKRIPVIVWIYRLFHLRYGTCNICGMPWSNCEHHDIPITKYESFFPVCEHCWKHKSKEKNLEAVKKVYEEWYRSGYRPYHRGILVDAFEKEWDKTH